MLTSSMTTMKSYNPALRGYHAVYRENAVNHCPAFAARRCPCRKAIRAALPRRCSAMEPEH